MNPLSQLADIHVPEDVSAWPPAWGYWLLLALALMLIALTLVLYFRRKAKLADKRKSLKQLNALNANDERFLEAVHHLLKTSVHSYLPSTNPLQMSANEWSSCIRDLYSGKDKEHVCEPLQQLAKWQYDERIALAPNNEIKQAAIAWIKHALPPKKGAKHV